jgi:GAF domain-containing protein
MSSVLAAFELRAAAQAEWLAVKESLRIRRAKILQSTAASLLVGQDPDVVVMPKLFRALLEERIIDATLGFVVVDMEQPLRLGFMEGFEEEMVRRCLTLDFGQAICGTVAKTRQAMHVTDIQRNLDPLADLVRSEGINAYACEPLIVGERLLGTLSFATRSRRSFDSDDLLFFRAVASQVAKARDRKRRKGAQTQLTR